MLRKSSPLKTIREPFLTPRSTHSRPCCAILRGTEPAWC